MALSRTEMKPSVVTKVIDKVGDRSLVDSPMVAAVTTPQLAPSLKPSSSPFAELSALARITSKKYGAGFSTDKTLTQALTQ